MPQPLRLIARRANENLVDGMQVSEYKGTHVIKVSAVYLELCQCVETQLFGIAYSDMSFNLERKF